MYARSLSWTIVGLILLSGCSLQQQVKGTYYLETGKYEQGIESFQEEVRRNPSLPAANYYLGRFYLAEDKPQDALRYLKRAVQHDPSKADYHFWLGVAYHENKRPDLERKSYLNAVSLDEKHHQALTYLGHSQLEGGQLSAALDSYSKALTAKPDIPDALYNRGLILKRLKRTPEERKAWKQYLGFYPSGAMARSAVTHLNALGDYEYQNYRVGYKLLPLKCVEFEPLSSKLRKDSHRSLDQLGAELAGKKEFILHVVVYQKNNAELAKSRSVRIEEYLQDKFPEMGSEQIKLSWFGLSKTMRSGKRSYTLDETVNFVTEMQNPGVTEKRRNS
jgi:tetratricopeptide (TPR) repeat protein